MKWVLPSTYKNQTYPYQRSADEDSLEPVWHPVTIVGAGPTGLAAALDLANRNIPCVLLSKENTVSIGSRAICFAKKTLEITNRLSTKIVEQLLQKGVTWNKGKVFYQEDLVYEFNLLPEEDHKVPAFINLQQYYFEEYLVNAIEKHPLIDLRWHNEVKDVSQDENKVNVKIKTPEGEYSIETDYLLACDGVSSPTREWLDVPFEGEEFEENFLIADITMENDFPTERWFWFDPPFNKDYSALLHKQPDGVWRIDLQLGRDINKEKELEPERIKARLRKMLGEELKFELEWTSIYQFRCMRIEEFVHGRVIFAGDSAHLLSPFGARGANSGIQDTDNLVWKLAYVMKGIAPSAILKSYKEERGPATDENIYYSSSATDFISPKSETSLTFRNAALDLAKTQVFAQELINSGRLSHPYRYLNSSLTTADKEKWEGQLQAGYAVNDLILYQKDTSRQFIDLLDADFTLVLYHSDPQALQDFKDQFTATALMLVAPESDKEEVWVDRSAAFAQRYDVKPGSWYLIRPDHHIAARGRQFDYEAIQEAIKTALGYYVASAESIPEHFPKHSRDDFYHLLIKAHDGLSKEESDRLNAKLTLLLLDQVEDKEEWKRLLQIALNDK